MKKFMFLLFVITICSQLTQALPTHISVSGITTPANANGIYTISASTFQANTYGLPTYSYSYYYWTFTNGGTTYYIYFYQYDSSTYAWNIDTDMDDNSVLFYSQTYWLTANTYAPLQPNYSPFTDNSPDLTSGWSGLDGMGSPNLKVSPTTQTSSILLPSNAAGTQLNISWANGNGTSRAVFMKQGTGAITNPTDGLTYTASTNWSSKGTQLGSSAYYCIYNGTGNSVAVTNTIANTQYTVQVFEYNGPSNIPVFNTSTATGNPSNATSLPVELTSFTSSATDSKVILNWQTATEVNNYGFEILRRSAPQNDNWEKVGFVQGHGNSNSPKSYSFTDVPNGGTEFKYRLKQIDFDGKYEYSPEVEVKLEVPSGFSVEQNFPNPFNPTTKIEFAIPTDNNVEIKVFNVLGMEVAALLNEHRQAGIYSIEFDASKLSSGIYFYKIVCGSNSEIKKMILLR